MLTTWILTSLTLVAQGGRPASRPADRAGRTGAEARVRTLPAKWGPDAPGMWAVRDRRKFAPIERAPYCSAAKAGRRVHDEDIVIGIRVGTRAVAYPIKMLGGPHREIINETLSGQPFAVNW